MMDDRMVTLMLVDGDCSSTIVECPARGILPGMIVEFGDAVGVIKAVFCCKKGSAAYAFCCAMAGHVPWSSTKVYTQCWEACNG